MKQLDFPTFKELADAAKDAIEGNQQAVGYPNVAVKLTDDLYLVFNPDFSFGVEFELQFYWNGDYIDITSSWQERFEEACYEEAKKEITRAFTQFVKKLV
ncbi:MAG: hypothetical protein NC218_01970 [Acetobacter sp.]|nr:hypothetical protein [Acetobacter sp.]